VRVLRDQMTDEEYVSGGNRSASIFPFDWHVLPVCQSKKRNASPGSEFFMR
jgi:hypothetical protein